MSASNIIFHPANSQEMNALKAIGKALKMKFEIVSTDEEYNTEFVKKIELSKSQYQKGEYTKVGKDELNSFLGL
jgi:methanogenic corrinoid protein MtbC1